MKHTLLALPVCLMTATAGWASTLTDTFTSYYAFGDSLSDDGKLADGQLNALSDDGRFSNGLIWTELLAQQFLDEGLSTENYALGGATAQGGDAMSLGFSTFQEQRNVFGANSLGAPIPLAAPLDEGRVLQLGDPGFNPLTSVWFGANDLLGQNGFDNREDLARAAADAVTDGVFEIFQATSGLFDDFLIANLPDIGRTPLYLLDAFADVRLGTAEEISGAVDAFNEQLSSNIASLRELGLQIFELDVATLFDSALDDPLGPEGAFPFLNVSIPCIASFGVPGPNCTQDPTIGPDGVNALLFADSIHPTAPVHALIAAEAEGAALTPVPLPAGLPLLLAGVGGLALLKRRKRATAA